MNASSFVYIDVVIICTMMSFYQQILHSFSCYNVLCIGNLTYAGHFAVCPSTEIIVAYNKTRTVQTITDQIFLAHTLSGCDTVSQLNGLNKYTVFRIAPFI